MARTSPSGTSTPYSPITRRACRSPTGSASNASRPGAGHARPTRRRRGRRALQVADAGQRDDAAPARGRAQPPRQRARPLHRPADPLHRTISSPSPSPSPSRSTSAACSRSSRTRTRPGSWRSRRTAPLARSVSAYLSTASSTRGRKRSFWSGRGSVGRDSLDLQQPLGAVDAGDDDRQRRTMLTKHIVAHRGVDLAKLLVAKECRDLDEITHRHPG